MEGLSIGFLVIRWNGILILIGISAGAILTTLELKRRSLDASIMYELLLPMMTASLIGARLWHLLTPPLSSVQLGLTTRYYFANFLDALALWRGGFGIPGALLGGAIALWVFARVNKLNMLELFDSLAPGIALLQAIGRLGNFFNQELYGLPTRLPWKIFIEPAYRLNGYEAKEYYHPLFAYESLLNLACMFILLWLSRRMNEKFKAGDYFLVYLIGYSIIRFSLEFLRLDISLVYGFNINQAFFALVFGSATLSLYLRHRAVQEL